MMARILGGAACALAFVLGAPWWACVAALAGFMVPGRLAPVAGTIVVLAFLPAGIGPAWTSLALVAVGTLAAAACLVRLGGAIPWVALPWLGGVAAILLLAWPFLPPDGFWEGTDVAVRARILVLAAVAMVGMAVTYRPRYRDEVQGVALEPLTDEGSRRRAS